MAIGAVALTQFVLREGAKVKWPIQFCGAARAFRTYWKIYGGWRAVFESPYAYAAAGATALMAPIWLRPSWWDLVLSILPSLLGFSLAGFAVFLAFGDDGFRRVIGGKRSSDESDEASPYLQFSAAFLHFIVVQILAICASLFAKSFYMIRLTNKYVISFNEIIKPIWWAFGFLLFAYAILSALAAAMAIFALTRSFDDYLTETVDELGGRKCGNCKCCAKCTKNGEGD
ncbi:MAG TPA: hypothetical protein VFE62_12760 [Gemmataceae bacterium]|nr:hypothetical protein [Gemmataceae bacterium]